MPTWHLRFNRYFKLEHIRTYQYNPLDQSHTSQEHIYHIACQQRLIYIHTGHLKDHTCEILIQLGHTDIGMLHHEHKLQYFEDISRK